MTILLVHGLGRTRRSFAVLAHRLARAGHRPAFFSYSARHEPYAGIVARLVTQMRALAAGADAVGLVGHSFGGLLLRAGIAAVPELRVQHLVMLATPNRPPRLAVRVYTRWPFRRLRGECGQALADAAWFEHLPQVTVPYTIVAGTGGWCGRCSPFDDEPNDGAVAVSETRISDQDQPVLIPALHTFIMNSRVVSQVIATRLAGPE